MVYNVASRATRRHLVATYETAAQILNKINRRLEGLQEMAQEFMVLAGDWSLMVTVNI